MDELEDHANWTKTCFTTMEADGEGWDPVKLALPRSPPHPAPVIY